MTDSTIVQLLQSIDELKRQNESILESRVNDQWLPKGLVMQFFDYGETQMAALLKNPLLRVRTIGKRKFIHKESIANLLNTSENE